MAGKDTPTRRPNLSGKACKEPEFNDWRKPTGFIASRDKEKRFNAVSFSFFCKVLKRMEHLRDGIAQSHGGIISHTSMRSNILPIEFFSSTIAVGFVTVWLMVGQFSVAKS